MDSTQKRKLKEYEEDLRFLTIEKEDLLQRNKQLQDEINSLKKTVNERSIMSVSAASELENLRSKVQILEEKQLNVDQEESNGKKVKQLEEQVTVLESALHKSKNTVVELKRKNAEQTKSHQNTVDAMQAEMDKIRSSYAEKVNEVVDLRSNLELERERSSVLSQKLQHLKSTIVNKDQENELAKGEDQHSAAVSIAKSSVKVEVEQCANEQASSTSTAIDNKEAETKGTKRKRATRKAKPKETEKTKENDTAETNENKMANENAVVSDGSSSAGDATNKKRKTVKKLKTAAKSKSTKPQRKTTVKTESTTDEPYTARSTRVKKEPNPAPVDSNRRVTRSRLRK